MSKCLHIFLWLELKLLTGIGVLKKEKPKFLNREPREMIATRLCVTRAKERDTISIAGLANSLFFSLEYNRTTLEKT